MGRKLQEAKPRPHRAFGDRLTAAVARKGWGDLTNIELGKKLTKVTGASANNWLNGYKLPSTETCIEIAVILNVSLDWLLIGRGAMDYQHPQGDIIYIGHVPQEAQSAIKGLIETFDKAPPGAGDKT